MNGKTIVLICLLAVLVQWTSSLESLEPNTGSGDDETENLAKIDEKLNGAPKKVVHEWNKQFKETSDGKLKSMTHNQDEILTALRKMDTARNDLIHQYKFLVKRRHGVRNFLQSTTFKQSDKGKSLYVPSEKTCFDQLMGLLKNKLFMSHTEWQAMYTSYIHECKKSRPNYVYVISHHHNHHHFYVTHVTYDPVPEHIAAVRHGFSKDDDVVSDSDSDSESKKKTHPSNSFGYMGTGLHPFDMMHPIFNPYYLPPFHGLSPKPEWVAEYKHYMSCNKAHYELESQRGSVDYDSKYKEWLADCHPDEHIRRLHGHISRIHNHIRHVQEDLDEISKHLDKQKKEWREELAAKEGESTYDQLHRIWASMKDRRAQVMRKDHCEMVQKRLVTIRDLLHSKKVKSRWEKTYQRFRSTCYEDKFNIEPTKKLAKKVDKIKKEDKLVKKLHKIEAQEKKTKKKMTETKKKPDLMAKTFQEKMSKSNKKIEELERMVKKSNLENKALMEQLKGIRAKKKATDKSNDVLHSQKQWKEGFGLDILGKQASETAGKPSSKDDDLDWWVKHAK